MAETLYNEKWDGVDCPICRKDCWDNRIALAIEIAKKLNQPFSMKALYNRLAKEHTPARWCEKRQTPWNTFFRDLYQSQSFEKVSRGMFRLTDKPPVLTKTNARGDLSDFENNIKKLMLLKEAKLISEEEYLRKGKELLNSVHLSNAPKETEEESNITGGNMKSDVVQIREDFLSNLVGDGIRLIHNKKNLYRLGLLDINVKVVKKTDMGWFNVSRNYLDELNENSVDLFVWICGRSDNYYVIPAEKMRLLVKNASIDDSSRNKNPHFDILFEGGRHYFCPKGQKIPIDEYYRNNALFKSIR